MPVCIMSVEQRNRNGFGSGPFKSVEVFPLDFCGGSTIKPFVYIELHTVQTVGWILSSLIPMRKEELAGRSPHLP